MPDLSSDLRTYVDAIVRQLPVEPVATLRPRPRRPGPRRAWLLAAAVLAIVVLITGITVVRASDGGEEVQTATGADVAAGGWERIAEAFPEGAVIADVTAGPNGFVAVGSVANPDSTPSTSPRIWTSADGRSWAPTDDLALTAVVSRLDGVAYGRGAYWAVGGDRPAAVTLRSTDGRNWNALESFPPSGGRLVADGVGLVLYDADESLASIVSSVDDGRTWGSGGYQGGPDGDVHVVVQDGERLVAVVSPSSGGPAQVWTCVEGGGAWQPAGDFATPAPTRVAAARWQGAFWAAAYGPGIGDRTQLWRADDTMLWAPVGADVPSGVFFETLTAVGPQLVATGFDLSASRPGAWVSTDGTTWTAMPDAIDRPPGGRLNRVAAHADRVVALGTELRDVYIWSSSGAGTGSSSNGPPPTLVPTALTSPAPPTAGPTPGATVSSANMSDDEREIRAAFETWVGGVDEGELAAAIEDYEQLENALRQGIAQNAGILDRWSIRFDSVQMVGDGRAIVPYALLLDGRQMHSLIGDAVRIDGRWLVSRKTICDALSRGGIVCPPRDP